jgi:anthranilate synthase component 2
MSEQSGGGQNGVGTIARRNGVMTLLIDNYDSFSYNLYQYIGETMNCGGQSSDIKVIRNDKFTADEIREMKPLRIVISPGPGKPCDAGCCIDVIRKFYKSVPILGICLGHQAIFEAFGGTVGYAKQLMHGKSSVAALNGKCSLFAGLPSEIQVARYHSLAGVEETLPAELEIIAKTTGGEEIMGVKHREYPVFGLQFHPESILTPLGKKMIENFLGANAN